jgi:hypothetical protein
MKNLGDSWIIGVVVGILIAALSHDAIGIIIAAVSALLVLGFRVKRYRNQREIDRADQEIETERKRLRPVKKEQEIKWDTEPDEMRSSIKRSIRNFLRDRHEHRD